MKKLLLSSIALFLFSAAIVMFQMSCKKEAKADTVPTTEFDGLKQLGKILYRISGTDDFYLANYDGSGKQKLNIGLPTGFSKTKHDSIDEVHLSPDGKKMFVKFYIGSANGWVLYSYDADGSNMKKVLEGLDNFFDVY
ncbi:hypothetical protein [Pedobacter sp. UBA4863]|uniref:hypothetical protein n=1 Tax=Pedobacter sp. UBA4863 TaxID=1947060 RepID=UPI0025FD1E39|nr:hypothetical protein [Pedobacter sp. UBA4863]